MVYTLVLVNGTVELYMNLQQSCPLNGKRVYGYFLRAYIENIRSLSLFCQVGERYTWRDRDLIFYLSYFLCLQRVKKSFDKQKRKGHTTVLWFNRFQESQYDVSGIWAVNQNWKHSEWVSNDSLMDMNTMNMNNDRLGHE